MKIINITSYPLFLGGGERLVHNFVSHTQYEATYRHKTGGIEYTKSKKFKAYENIDELRELIRNNRDAVFILHDPDTFWMPVFHECEHLIWYVHGAYCFGLDFTHAAKPFACISNYIPEVKHPSWANVPVLPFCLGVDDEVFTVPKKVAKGGTLRVGIVGRISEEKIPLYWFDFVEKFNREHAIAKKVEFQIYGKGLTETDYFKAFHKRVNSIPNIKFKGELPIDEIHKAYHDFDLLMVPSFTETGSYTIVEAQMSGLRVLALNRDGIPNHLTRLSSACIDYDEMFARLAKETVRDNITKRREQRQETLKRHSLGQWVTKIEKVAEIAFLQKSTQSQPTK